MATELQHIKDSGITFLEKCEKLTCRNESERAVCNSLVLAATERVKQIKKIGAIPVKAAADNLATTKKHFGSIAQPFILASELISKKLGAYLLEQRKAQNELQREEVQRALTSHTPAEIVIGPEKTQKTEEGSVTMRLIKTFDFGSIIVDGQIIDGMEANRTSEGLRDLPDFLFTLDMVATRKWALSGVQCVGLKGYVKPSISKRVSTI